jgi:DNA-binding NarL/FixJ family response regulator
MGLPMVQITDKLRAEGRWDTQFTVSRHAAPRSTPGSKRQSVVRILIADDHAIIRESLRSLLSRRPDWQICGEATNGREAVSAAKQSRPDVVILDLSMPDLNGLEATLQIRKALPSTEILIFTMHHPEDRVRQIIAAGARGYLIKSDAVAHLEAAIEALAQHKPYFTSKVTQIMLDTVRAATGRSGVAIFGAEPLTAREREIVQLLAEGKSNKQISGLLGLTVATVQTHRTTIMHKLGVSSVAELVRYAVRNKIIEA